MSEASIELQEQHKRLVANLAKRGDLILKELVASDCHLLHMAIGVSGEAGELLDAIKKATIYRKPLDLENVIEELGDIEFYLEGIRYSLGLNREITLAANITKLNKRYEKGYSNQAAQERKDKI